MHAFYRRTRILAASTFVALATALPLISQDAIDPIQSPAAAPTAEDIGAWLDGFMPHALATADIAGAVITVTNRDNALISRGYGMADIATNLPVDPEQTLFRAGSVSKLFTWTSVMQLVEDGAIDLDADLQEYLDFDVPTAGRPVTMRDLMTHRAGFAEVLKFMISDMDNFVPLERYLKENLPVPLTPPGEATAYSNYGTALAGHIVARVSGKTFETYVQRHILDPLGMTSSSFAQPLTDSLNARMSSGYLLASDERAMPFEIIVPSPAGGLSSTGEDMARFVMAHLSGQVPGLSDETLALMHAKMPPLYDGLDGSALGFLERHWGDTRIIGHSGDTQYFHSDLQLFPEQGLGYYVALNSNGRGAASHILRQALLEGFAQRYVGAVPQTPPAVDTAFEHGAAVVGTYDSTRTSGGSFLDTFYILGQTRVTMNAQGELLATVLPNAAGQPQRWREIKPWVWQAVDGDERLMVQRKGGRVTGFAMDPFAGIMEFRRVPTARSVDVLLPVAVLSLVIVVIMLLAWPIGALIRRRYGIDPRMPSYQVRTLKVARLSALAVVGLLVLWIALFSYVLADLSRLSNALDPWLQALQWGVLISAVAVGAGIWNAATSWTTSASWLSRTWSAIFGFAITGLVWTMYSGGLFSFTMAY